MLGVFHVEPTADEKEGMEWFNGLSEAARSYWLDQAWRRHPYGAARISYRLDDMPSAADAWKEFKRCGRPAGRV
jgi:hypothetical protein